MKTIKVFLASSEELEQDRRNFGYLVDELNSHYSKRGVKIELLMWERFDSAYNGKRKQDEYNEQIITCDIFIALFYKKAGLYTREEIDCALDEFKKTKRPKIFFYMKNLEKGEQETPDLIKFEEDYFHSLHHYPCRYSSYEGMKSLFMQELENFIYDESKDSFDKSSNDSYNDESSLVVEPSSVRSHIQIGHPVASKNILDDLDDDLLDTSEQRPFSVRKLYLEFKQFQKTLSDSSIKLSRFISDQHRGRVGLVYHYMDLDKVSQAEQILDVKEIEDEADIELEQLAITKENLTLVIEELATKAKIIINDPAYSTKEGYGLACKVIEKALIIADKINLEPKKKVDYLFDYAKDLANFGNLHESMKTYQKMILILKDLTENNNNELLPLLAGALNNLGNEYLKCNNFNDSETNLKQSLDLRRSLAEDDPDEFLPRVEQSLMNLARLYEKFERYEEAEQKYLEIIKIFTPLIKRNGQEYKYIIARGGYNQLGILHSHLKQYDNAEEDFKKALDICKELAEKDNANLGNLGNVDRQLNNLSILYKKQNRLEEAEEILKERVTVCRKMMDIDKDISIDSLTSAIVSLR